ncbi:hypothetical protein AWENTII_010964 [Aspergillus wentii]
MYGPMYIETENQLPFVVGYILMAAVNMDQIRNVLVKKKEDIVTSELLLQAAGVLGSSMDIGSGAIISKMIRERYAVPYAIEGET